jgi:hypothetical protein
VDTGSREENATRQKTQSVIAIQFNATALQSSHAQRMRQLVFSGSAAAKIIAHTTPVASAALIGVNFTEPPRAGLIPQRRRIDVEKRYRR